MKFCLSFVLLFCFTILASQPDWRALQRDVEAGKVKNVSWSQDSQNLFFNMATGKVQRSFSVASKKFEKKSKPSNTARYSRKRLHGKRWPNCNRILSPDSQSYAVHSNNNVYIEHDNKTTQLTKDGTRWARYGAVSWLYNEDSGQFDGMWWSPNSDKLAYYKFDERNVPQFPVSYKSATKTSEVVYQGYPNPGDPIPIATLFVYDLKSKKTMPIDCGSSTNQYIYHIKYSPDGKLLFFNRLDRRQRKLELVKVDLETGKTKVIACNERKTFQYNESFVDFIKGGKQFIWGNYDNGFTNYEIRDMDGNLIIKFIDALYQVESILKIDETNNWVYYTAYSPKEVLNLQLHKIRLDGTGHQQLTKDELNYGGRKRIFEISPDGKYFVAQSETIEQPANTFLYDTEGNKIVQLGQGNLAPFKDMPARELFTFKADDGETDIYGIIDFPWNFNPSNKYAILNRIYCGTGSKDVFNIFGILHSDARKGYITVKIDARGTHGRGYKFMEAVYGKVGVVELKDQADGMRLLLKRPYVDPERVGVYGTSHGGFMTGRAMVGYPDIFKVGVANAGVHDWRYYSVTYAERFQDLPEFNKEGYDNSSTILNAKNLQGKFLIQHGMIDVNVHVNNALALADALHQADKDFELQIYPNNGHYIGRKGYEKQAKFLKKHLLDPYDEQGNKK